MREFRCAKGCGRVVAGVYCETDRDKARAERLAAEEAFRLAASERMKARWELMKAGKP